MGRKRYRNNGELKSMKNDVLVFFANLNINFTLKVEKKFVSLPISRKYFIIIYIT